MSDAREKALSSKILLVDDNKDALDSLSLLLEFEGFAVVTAQTGLEALELLKTDRQVSLVLLDVWMPVMNGWEFLRQKAAVETIANIPVIVLSANPPWDRPDGTQAVFRKPPNPEGLIDTIKRYI